MKNRESQGTLNFSRNDERSLELLKCGSATFFNVESEVDGKMQQTFMTSYIDQLLRKPRYLLL